MSRNSDMGAAIKTFRQFARYEGIAVRKRDNASHTSRGVESRELGISMIKAVEDEFGRCFVMVKEPDWDAVQAAALGEK